MTDWIGFIFCCLVIFYAGRKLSVYGDQLAILKGWGKAWVGLILLASVTSLPELIVGVSSAAIIGSADLAVGNIIGSCAFNIGILAILDAFVPGRKPIFTLAGQSHVMAAAMGMILIAMVGIALYLPEHIFIVPGIGLISILFIVFYLISMRLMYSYEVKNKILNHVSADLPPEGSTKKVIGFFILFSVIITAAALFLPVFADNIAEQTGLSKTFIGTLLLATSTSLPELSVSYAAVRMGSVDLSLGNILGSNMFNIFILATNDFFYLPGHLLKDASDTHMISILATIIMTAIAIIGLTYRIDNKRYSLGWDTFLILAVYILNMFFLYRLS